MVKLQQGTPGPKYDVSKITRHGVVKPTGAVMIFKQKVQRTTFSPGPAAYIVNHIIKNQPPMYSMGMRRPARKTPCAGSPGPGKYAVPPTIGNRAPDVPSAPAYTMPAWRRGAGAANGTPGPAGYPAVDVAWTTAQAPRPVMLGRPGRRDAGTRTPAPNAYSPGPGGSRYARAPAAFMAGRIARQAGPYMTATDREPAWESW